jgi:hypothetical protein
MIYNDNLKSSYDSVGAEPIKQPPVPFKPKPAAKDYETGYIYRTFAKKVNEKAVVEVGGNVRAGDISPLYAVATLAWKITGPKDDRRNGRIVEDVGVVNYNRAEIARVLAENDIDLAGVLTDLTEYWRGY